VAVSIADLADGVPASLLDEDGQITEPLLLVGLDDGVRVPQAVLARAAARATECDRLLVGVASEPVPVPLGPLLRALDLTLAAAPTDVRECVTVAARSRKPRR
jgi:hypothetical protein